MSEHPANQLSLVADIGGTNTRVALADGARLLPATVRRYSNAEYPGLETVLKTYIKDEGDVDCRAICVAVAGPVRDGVGTMTNLDWQFDRDTLMRASRAEHGVVLNDLQAQGHALGHVAAENIRPIVTGGTDAGPDAAQLVIGVGTGFNMAPVWNLPTGRVVTPSECGHANLPIRTDAELRLCQYVETAHGFPAVEDVLSGRGLERVYRFFGHEAGDARELAAAAIMQAAAEDDPRATEAVKLFVRILGTVAGNLALIQLPFGGVYLVGGVARAMTPYLQRFGFAEAFRDKGRFAGFMQNFSVSIIEDDYAALTGCAGHLAATHNR